MSHSSSSSHVGLGHYLLTWVVLMVLAGVSYGLVFVSMGPWSLAVILVIAAVKALLVGLVFMHLVDQGGTVRLAAVTGVAFVLLLTVLMAFDVVTRAVG